MDQTVLGEKEIVTEFDIIKKLAGSKLKRVLCVSFHFTVG
jgi:hypothetical protein